MEQEPLITPNQRQILSRRRLLQFFKPRSASRGDKTVDQLVEDSENIFTWQGISRRAALFLGATTSLSLVSGWAFHGVRNWLEEPDSDLKRAGNKCREIEQTIGSSRLTVDQVEEYKTALSQVWVQYYPTKTDPQVLSNLLTVVGTIKDYRYSGSKKDEFLICEEINNLNELTSAFSGFQEVQKMADPIYKAKDKILRSFVAGAVDNSQVTSFDNDVLAVYYKYRSPALRTSTNLIVTTKGLALHGEPLPNQPYRPPDDFQSLKYLVVDYLISKPNRELNLNYRSTLDGVGDISRFEALLGVNRVSAAELFDIYKTNDLAGFCERLSTASPSLSALPRVDQIDYWVKNFAISFIDESWNSTAEHFPQIKERLRVG